MLTCQLSNSTEKVSDHPLNTDFVTTFLKFQSLICSKGPTVIDVCHSDMNKGRMIEYPERQNTLARRLLLAMTPVSSSLSLASPDPMISLVFGKGAH